MSRYRVFRVTRYRFMSYQARYRVTLTPILTPISGTRRYQYPTSGHSVTDIVHYIPDIGVNIRTNIWMPDIGNCNNRSRCQYRIQYRVIPTSVSVSDTISGVPISGFKNLRYRHQYWTRYRASNCQCAPPGVRSS
jgi:hypothetical protein